jgi:HSP20 family protein
MGFLEKWKSSRELDRFRSEFDDLIERFGFDRDWFGRFPFDRELFGRGEPAPTRPAIESYVEGGKFIVRTDLPGIEPKDVDIKVVGNMLTVKGSREEKRETKKADFLRREIHYGSFERSISLPEGIKAEDLKATYHDGVLELTAPMPKEAVPKEVKIQVEGPKGNTEKKVEAA